MTEPKIRFKRDDGSSFPDWEEIAFDSLYEPLNNNTYSRDCLNYESGKAKNIHYGDILVKFGEICDVQKEELPFVNDGNAVQKYVSLQDGDIVLADTAEDETVGKAIEMHNVNGENVISGLHTMACRPRLSFAPKYLGYYMNSSSYHSQLKPYMQGIKVTSIGRKNIAETMISYPSDEKEQQKIADFLSNVDEVIAASEEEVVKLKELKKGCLQKMFPQGDAKVPEVRFPGFNGDWEQRKLSDEVSSIDTGKSKFDAKESGDYEILGSTGVIGYDDSFDYEGDFLLTARVGANAGTLYRHSGKVKITDNTVFLQGSHIDFAFYLLDKFDLKKMSFGSGQPLIKASELKCLELMMPVQNEEKEKIATYFFNLDNLITLHQRECDKWKELKKGLLQQMFV